MRDKKIENLLVVAFLMCLGAIPRLYSAATASVPLHDGGLFYTMIRDIQANGFFLPVYTSYNGAGIPLAYPPLGFYLAGFVALLGKASILDVLRLLPPVISILTIPVFYSFSRSFLNDDVLAFFSSLVFVTIPPVFNWSIMGGGLTRSLGLLFALLSVHELFLLTSSPKINRFLLAGIFAGFTMLSHPAAILFVAYSAVFFILISRRKIDSFLRFSLAGVTCILLTLPWWLTILSRFGLSPFFSISGNSFNPLQAAASVFFLRFTSEQILQIWAVLGFWGVFLSFKNRKIVLPAWVLIITLLQGRGWETFIQVPFTMLVGGGFVALLLVLGRSYTPGTEKYSMGQIFESRLSKIGFVYILMLAMLSAFLAVPGPGLSQKQVAAMEWIEVQVPLNSSFALITGDSGDDVISEWFPALTQRTSLATAQGLEWQGEIFKERILNHSDLQQCANQTLKCLEQWSDRTGSKFQYVYVVVSPTAPFSTGVLLNSLNSSSTYKNIYESSEVQVFSMK